MKKAKLQTETSNKEILDAVNGLATHVEKRFSRLESDVSEIKEEIRDVKKQMVTKDYLDERMSDLRGDIVLIIRKEDRKSRYIADILFEKQIFTEKNLKEFYEMEPFPEIKLDRKK